MALAAAVVVAIHPAGSSAPSPGLRSRMTARLPALLLLLAALVPTLLLLLLTGKARSSTAEVKLLSGSPYLPVLATAVTNAHTLAGTILDGGVWSAEFLPSGGAAFAFAGLVATVLRGVTTRRFARATLVLLLAAAMFAPCFYVTFLWNRLRYLWPFATGWFVGLACLARATASLAHRLRLGARLTGPIPGLVAGAFAGALAVRLDWVLEDVAQSASGIARQQSALGRWAKENLPADARIGVNDTGAIAYFGDRLTFDVVGLTTPSEGRYWVAGAASRLEHYERLRQTSPRSLPTHFIVYPEWMGLPVVLGRALHEAVVTDSTILGGQIMRVYEARWDLLGSGEEPWTTFDAITDVLDVADLESEAAHRYELLGAREGEQTAVEEDAPDGHVVLDGGRTRRRADRFLATLAGEGPLVLVARLKSTAATSIRCSIDGRALGEVPLDAESWEELVFSVPDDVRGTKAIEVNAAGAATFTSFHYWIGRRAARAAPPPD